MSVDNHIRSASRRERAHALRAEHLRRKENRRLRIGRFHAKLKLQLAKEDHRHAIKRR